MCWLVVSQSLLQIGGWFVAFTSGIISCFPRMHYLLCILFFTEHLNRMCPRKKVQQHNVLESDIP